MKKPNKCENWGVYAGISALMLVVVMVIASVTKIWVLTAIPVGFLLGFFIQRGDLCGASAFSEVLLLKSGSKVWGIWVWIVTGMVGLAIVNLLGWATLNPKPFIWLNYLVGGLVFGAGTVLAGGCVSGTLFKTGVGHISSMVALVGIAIGVATVEYGPLKALQVYFKKSFLIKAANGGPVTLSSVTGMPFWLLAVIIAVLTIVAALFLRKKEQPKSGMQINVNPDDKSWSKIFTGRSWKPWQAGLALGVLTTLALLSSAPSGRNYPLGVTHGVLHTQMLLTESNLKHVWRKAPPAPVIAKVTETSVKVSTSTADQKVANASVPKQRTVSWWLILGVLNLVIGSWIAAKMTGEARLYPKPPEHIIIAFFGGIMVGCGAAFAEGCFVGNMASGWALMSIGNVLFAITAILANWAATYFYLIGGSIFGLKD